MISSRIVEENGVRWWLRARGFTVWVDATCHSCHTTSLLEHLGAEFVHCGQRMRIPDQMHNAFYKLKDEVQRTR